MSCSGSCGWVLGGFLILLFYLLLDDCLGYSDSEPCSSALILSRYFADAFGSLLDLLS